MKTNRKKYAVRACLLLGASMLLGFLTKKQLSGSTIEMNAQTPPIPARGIAQNDTGGKVPGDPQNGIQDLKRIYTFINFYRERYQGAYPMAANQLMSDLYRNPQSYGLKRVKDGWPAFFNPDARYADAPGLRQWPERQVVYQFRGRRLNGSRIDEPKPAGTRDVLAFTPIYVHNNARQFPKERSQSNPVGFYLVLWDDGEVAKIPYHQVLYAPNLALSTPSHPTRKGYDYAFPGQAGLPPGTITYDQFHRKLGWKNGGPRGKEGGPGLSYNMVKLKR